MEKVNSIISSQHGGYNIGVVGSGGTFCRFSSRFMHVAMGNQNLGVGSCGYAIYVSQMLLVLHQNAASVLLLAIDVFASSVASLESRLLLMKEIGKMWVVREAEVEYLQRHHKPAFQNMQYVGNPLQSKGLDVQRRENSSLQFTVISSSRRDY